MKQNKTIYQVENGEEERTMVFAKLKDANKYRKTLGEYEYSQIVPITLTGTKVEVAMQVVNRLGAIKQNEKAYYEAMQHLNFGVKNNEQ